MPPRPRSQLYRWQAEVAAQLARRPLLVAAQPGSGKTATFLAAAADGLAEGRFRRILVIASQLLLDSVWVVEAGAWEHTRHLTFDMAHRLSGAARERLWFEGGGAFVTCTPDTLPVFVKAAISRRGIKVDAVFVDEAQLFKDPASNRAGALLALARIVPSVTLASGTPTPNGPIDGWTPGRLVSPDNPFFEPSFTRWRAKHFVPGATPYTFKPKPGTAERVADELSKVGVAMLLRDATDVPPELHLDVLFEHDEAHRAAIAAFLTHRQLEIEGEVFAAETDGAFLVRLHALGQGFVYLPSGRTVILSRARVEALAAVIGGVAGPVLVATRYKADIAMIRERFPDAVAVDGATPARERGEIIARFNADRIPLLVANAAAFGHGINLQKGSCQTVVWFTGSWSYELFAQFNARLVRSGQGRRVSIITLKSTIGLDAALAAVIAAKAGGEAALLHALARERPLS